MLLGMLILHHKILAENETNAALWCSDPGTTLKVPHLVASSAANN